MNSYVEIKILPDPEFTVPTLMNALFGKLHRILAELNSERVGVSFPGVDHVMPSLGNTLRLHGPANVLAELMGRPWLKGMKDHTVVSDVKFVPESTRHIAVRRVQVKSNPERLRRRLMRRHNLTQEEALQRIPESVPAKKLKLPYVSLKSRSTNRHFRLFFEHQPPQEHPVRGDFNTYGLGNGATVPWF